MSHTMAGVLNRHHAIVPNHDHTVLQNMYQKIIKYKSNKDYIRLNQTVKQLMKNSSLQGTAKKFKYSLHSPSAIDEYQKTK